MCQGTLVFLWFWECVFGFQRCEKCEKCETSNILLFSVGGVTREEFKVLESEWYM